MSSKTPRPHRRSAIALSTPRPAPQRLRALAYVVGLLVLGAGSSRALELGEASMRSGLGQSLVVHVPYRLADGERLAPECVSLASTATHRALPTYSRSTRIDITPTHIEIVGDARVLEPLIALTVDVRCPSAPHFARSYELFVDPSARMPSITADVRVAAAPRDARPTATVTIAAANTAALSGAGAAASPRGNASARARGQSGGPLTQGQTYTIVRGDTLSGIAARVADRPTIRATADAIFAANPTAFTRGNPDLIETGRTLTIPLLTTTAAPAASPLPVTTESAPPAPAPSVDAVPTPASELPTALAESGANAVAPAALEGPTLTFVPRSAPTATPAEAVAPPNPSAATDGIAPVWLTALLALGAALLLATPLLVIHRRKRDAAADHRAEVRAPQPRPVQPRTVANPVAGFDIIEGRLGRTQTNVTLAPLLPTAAIASDSRTATPAEAETAAATAGLRVDPAAVDLDVGTPVAANQSGDTAGDRTVTAVTVNAPVRDDTFVNAPTALLAQPDVRTAVEPAIDDEQHTLTIVEIDMLRQDYEYEHTLTQESSKTLQAAVADLKATQAARAAAAGETIETATLEMPRQAATTTADRRHDATPGKKRA